MWRWLKRRVLILVPTLIAIIIVSFLIIRLAPGSPFASERGVPPAVRVALAERFGLQEPILNQLSHYVLNLCQGDLGPSLRYPQHQVSELLAQGLGPTATLAAFALVWALGWGSVAGGAAAWARMQSHRKTDRVLVSLMAIFLSLPSFVVGPLFMLGLALGMGFLPPAGWGHASHIVLPSMTLGTVLGAQVARLVRGGLLDALDQPFVRTARAKGVGNFRLFSRHLIKPALVPLVTFLGPTLSGLLVGSVAIEKIFMVPGLGMFFVDAAFNRDYFVVMGVVLLESIVLLSANVLVDLAYAWLDPRVRLES